MIIGLVALAICLTLTFLATVPSSTGTAAQARRLHTVQLQRRVARVTSAEVETMLGHELPDDVTAEVCRLARTRKVPPTMLWTWAQTHSATLLALALSAGYTRRDLAATATAGTALDQESLEMLAELNGDLVGSLVARASRGSALPVA